MFSQLNEMATELDVKKKDVDGNRPRDNYRRTHRDTSEGDCHPETIKLNKDDNSSEHFKETLNESVVNCIKCLAMIREMAAPHEVGTKTHKVDSIDLTEDEAKSLVTDAPLLDP